MQVYFCRDNRYLESWLTYLSHHPHADPKTILDSGRVDRAVLLNIIFVPSELCVWNGVDPGVPR